LKVPFTISVSVGPDAKTRPGRKPNESADRLIISNMLLPFRLRLNPLKSEFSFPIAHVFRLKRNRITS
jgi:hypothetical protein